MLQHLEHPTRKQFQLVEADALGDAVATFGTDAEDASARPRALNSFASEPPPLVTS